MRAHSDFQRVFKEGTRLFRNGLGFCVRKAEGLSFRFGLSVPKRFGKAVERNKIRRRIREIVRCSVVLPECAEIVFCVNKPCRQLSFTLLKDACDWAFEKTGRLRLASLSCAR